MTDTTADPLTSAPAALVDWLRRTRREESVTGHDVAVGLTWWNQGQLDLPGLPLSASAGTDDRPRMTRGDIFALADDIDTTDGVLRLLWHTLAWGTGPTQRGNRKRILSVTADTGRLAGILTEAAHLSRTDPLGAFEKLRPGRRNVISGLGPAFFTKFLYFAGGGHPDHPCAIVDERVRATLEQYAGGFPRWSQYPAREYVRALEVLRQWTARASDDLGRPVALDEVEKWAFSPE